MFSFTRNGIGNLFFNTIYLVFLSLLVSVPLGIAAGIYMAEYAKPGKTTKFLRICIETLSSLPSIVVGLFGYLVFIVMTGSQWNFICRCFSCIYFEFTFDYNSNRRCFPLITSWV